MTIRPIPTKPAPDWTLPFNMQTRKTYCRIPTSATCFAVNIPGFGEEPQQGKKVERKRDNFLHQATHSLFLTFIAKRESLSLQMETPYFREIQVARDVFPIAENGLWETLGKGNYAKVFKVYDLLTHQPIALKIGFTGFNHFVKAEGQNLQRLTEHGCPNIADYLFSYEPVPGITAVAMSLESPSVWDHMKKGNGSLSLSDTFQIAHDGLVTLVWLESRRIIHGDISPPNIAYDPEKRQAKLLDFGLVGNRDDGRTRYCLQARAPEVMFKTYSSKADLWALGATLYWIYIGKPLFQINDKKNRSADKERQEIIDKTDILKQVFALIGPIPEYKFQSVPSPFASNRAENIQKDPNYFLKRFLEVATRNGEIPEVALKFWEFILLLVSHEERRPSAKDALAIFKGKFEKYLH